MGKAILPVRLSLLKEMFMLPGDYQITATAPDPGHEAVNFLIESPEIPAGDEGTPLRNMMLRYTVDPHPDDPEYRKITVAPEFKEQ